MTNPSLQHLFFIIIGPSGSGKTKVAEAVFPKDYKVISHTTRPKRLGEQEGVDYYFETQEQFQNLIQSNALAEYDTYNGQKYGVGIDELLRKTSKHCAYDVLTFQGFEAIEKLFKPMVVPIFLDVSKENVLTRLQERGDLPEIIKERSALYDQEIKNKEKIIHYPQHFIIDANQPFDCVVKSLAHIVEECIKKHD